MSIDQLNVDNLCQTSAKMIETCFVWTIDSLSHFSEKTGQFIESTIFSAPEDGHKKWCFRLYPNGDKEEFKDYIGLFLKLKESDQTSVEAIYEFGLIDSNGKIAEKTKSKDGFETFKGGKGFPNFMAKEALNDSDKYMLPNNGLTIYCKLKYWLKPVTISRQKFKFQENPIPSLINDLTKLYENQENADIEIVVSDKTINAHKLILMARSPVFAAMFKHQMAENKNNRVVIEDIKTEVFEELIKFIYTEAIKLKDIEFSKELLSAADKYQLLGLKYKCEEYIGNHLTIKSICDIIMFADKYSAEKLKSCSIDFIKHNLNAVKKTKGWERLADNTQLFHNTFAKIFL